MILLSETLASQKNNYKARKISRFIDQANEAIYFVEERERLGTNITKEGQSDTLKKRNKRITRIRKSFTHLRKSDLIEHAKEALLAANNAQQEKGLYPINSQEARRIKNLPQNPKNNQAIKLAKP